MRRARKAEGASPAPAPGRYEVLEVLAAGGMGKVHRCFDRLAQRHVAYKRLGSFADAERARLMALFQREYDTLARLTHPNIVEVYDYGFDADGPYYTMELLTGEDLTALAPLSFAEGARIVRDVASALSLLHARRLVHRDVTPGNVRLTRDGRAKLIDFGGLTPFGKPTEIVGTAAFVAPECLRDAELDQRADLYALGALAYWTFTRRTHVRARSLDDLAEAWREPVLPPSAYAPELPPEIDDLLLSLLRHDRDARPSSAADVMESLSRIADLPAERDEMRVAYSYLERPPLAGRDEPLSGLSHALRSATAGLGRVVWIEGERGLGRSALLDHVGVEAQLLGATVLRADGAMCNAPFSTARHLVEVGLATFPSVAAELARGSSTGAAVLPFAREERLARSALVNASRSAIDASERQSAIGSSLVQSLLAISQKTPLVLLIDDVHLADAESVALLASMVESIPRHRVLLALSALMSRNDERDPAVAKLVASATVCRLSSLSEQELGRVLKQSFGVVPNVQRLAQWLHRHTGGNPGHALELARLLLARGAVRYTVGTFVLPHEFDIELGDAERMDAQLARLADVSPAGKRSIELLALHDGPLRAEQIAAALELDVSTVVRELEELVARGAATVQQRLFACASAALRTAITRRLSPESARALHLALAHTLAQYESGSLEELVATARHLLLAGGPERLEGAYRMAQSGDAYRFEVAMMPRALPVFEEALRVLEEQKLPDRECVGVLMPLSLAGFYGKLELQQRYLDRTLRALGDLCGLTLARRLRPFLGARLALAVGLLLAFVASACRRSRLNRRSFLENLLAFTSVLGPATAAAACTYDVAETYRIASYCEPFVGAPRRSGLYCVREFCLATAELIEGRMNSAHRRYASLLEVVQQPVPGMDDALREQAILGCLNGMAHALVTGGDREALKYADQLAQRGAFYKPHVECVYMTYHATRGEAALAAEHRERAEAYALQGGMSWSALCTLSQRSMQAHTQCGDIVSLVRVTADLKRLARLAPSLALLAELAQANLDQLRGEPERALPVYERVLATELARRSPTYMFDVVLHAQALSALGEHARAKALLKEFLGAPTVLEFPTARRWPRQKLALAEAGLGNVGRALALLDECIAEATPADNLLELGSLHRDRAYVSALDGDRTAFAEHAAHMRRYFELTRNPSLMLQCDALHTHVARLGLIARPSLPAPAPMADDIHTTVGRTVGVTIGIPLAKSG